VRARIVIGMPIVLAALARVGHADDRLISEDTFAVHPPSVLQVDAGLLTGTPEALGTGISSGVIAGVTHTCGCALAYGARASWSTISATNTTWMLTEQDIRLRGTGELRHRVGRGAIALRLGAGATIVYEHRERSQQRMGLDPLATSAFDTLPAADLEAVIALKVTGAFGVVISGGPSLTYFEDGAHGKWTAELGLTWQP
jgi:hypothetical protein